MMFGRLSYLRSRTCLTLTSVLRTGSVSSSRPPRPIANLPTASANIRNVSVKKEQPLVILPNKARIPILGLGTWKSKPGEVKAAVISAIEAGYRHIDGAAAYQNEEEVGAGIRAKIKDNTVTRDDMFIVSKIWNTFHHPDYVEKGCKITLDALQLDCLDLYLIHWPMSYQPGGHLYPKDENDRWLFDDTHYTATWKCLEKLPCSVPCDVIKAVRRQLGYFFKAKKYQEMEKLVQKGMVKAIGVSNFNTQQIQDIFDIATIRPAVNQIELHPYLVQESTVKFCRDNGITVTAYSPLGSPDRPWIKDDDPRLMEDPTVMDIAKTKGKSPAQILIRFAIERNIVVIPKSVTPSRIQANFESLNFSLTSDEMDRLYKLDRNYRGCVLEWINHPLHPWPELIHKD